MAKGGKRPGSGRKAGVPNKLTKTVKEAFEAAFNAMQEHPDVKLEDWGKNNPTEFYKLASKLIPSEINAKVSAHESSLDLLEKGRAIAAK